MKRIVERAKQISKTVAVGIRRAVDPPLDDNATPLDLRHAIVESIEARVQAAGRGRRILPDAYVRAKVLAPDPVAQRALRTVLDDVQGVALARLRELRCEVAQDFRVDVVYMKSRPAAWTANQRLFVEYPEQAPPSTAPAADEPPPTLKLTVLKGTATKPSYSFSEAVIRVGRSDAPVDDRGKVRRNDVVFLETDDELNKTVTRGHCEIRYIRTPGEYRIFDERSANGTRILRGGEAIDVPARDPVGVAIRTGDELQFGKALVRVTIAR